MNTVVIDYLDISKRWKPELTALRTIVLDCGLEEEFKWRTPCYTFQNSNIILLGSFKEFCTLSFFKGTLLKDKENILVAPGPNSRSVKMATFTNKKGIEVLQTMLKEYIYEALEIAKSGQKVNFKEDQKLNFPEELEAKFNENLDFKNAFNNLTPGRQGG